MSSHEDEVKELPWIQHLLLEETQKELAEKERDFGVFSVNVMRALESEDRAKERRPIEERAIAEFRAEVQEELEAKEPAFENMFRARIEAKIAERRAGFFEKLWARVEAWFDAPGQRLKLGALGAAAMAVSMFVLMTARESDVRVEKQPAVANVAAQEAGEVSVDRVDFEGNVTVLDGEGLAVIWLSD